MITDDKGNAKLKGIKPGWIAIDASAPRLRAEHDASRRSARRAASGTVQLTLRKGYRGRPARSSTMPASRSRARRSRAGAESWGMSDEAGDADVITNAKGEFTIPALAAGTHRLTAIDGEHAPAWSTPITVKDAPITGVVITMKAGGTHRRQRHRRRRQAGRVRDGAGRSARTRMRG